MTENKSKPDPPVMENTSDDGSSSITEIACGEVGELSGLFSAISSDSVRIIGSSASAGGAIRVIRISAAAASHIPVNAPFVFMISLCSLSHQARDTFNEDNPKDPH